MYMQTQYLRFNQTPNHELQKESLGSDGQQFHQYQQNEQSPLTLTH